MRASEDNMDKALWLSLAQSWLRLIEHVAQAESSGLAGEPAQDEAP